MGNDQIGYAVPIEELKVPKILYKYRDYDSSYHRKLIFEGEIYIPAANEFNDPLDSKTPFRYREEDLTDENIFKKCLEIAKYSYPNRTEEQYHEIAYINQQKELLHDEQHIEKFDKNNYEETCRNYGIYCLTPDPVNFLMWSYYSNSHKGFCVGFNSAYLLGTGLFSIGGIVDYRKDFPKLPLFPSEKDHLFLNIFYVKWDIWKHENEYRLIHNYKKGKTFNLPKEAIAEIIFGCQFPEKEIQKLIPEIIKLYPNVTISQTKLSTGVFGLTKELKYDNSVIDLSIYKKS